MESPILLWVLASSCDGERMEAPSSPAIVSVDGQMSDVGASRPYQGSNCKFVTTLQESTET